MKKYIVLALTVLLLVFQSGTAGKAIDKIPYSFFFDKTTGITAEQWLNRDFEMSAAPCIRQKTGIGNYPVQTVYTTDNYAVLAGVPMKYGSFPWEGGQIVISDRLATKLFLTDDILGASVTLGDREYAVCGIYWTDESVQGKISQSIYEDVFLHLEDYEQQEQRLSEFFLELREYQHISDSLAQIEQYLGVSLQYRELLNLREQRVMVGQTFHLARLAAAAVLMIWCCLRLVPMAGGLIRKEGKASLWEWLSAAGMLLCLAGAVFLLYRCFFNLTLPQDWLEFQGSAGEYLWQWMKVQNEWKDFVIFRYISTSGKLSAFLGTAAVLLGIYGMISDLWRAYVIRKEEE